MIQESNDDKLKKFPLYIANKLVYSNLILHTKKLVSILAKTKHLKIKK